MAPLVPGSALLHFVLVEQRELYIYYFTLRLMVIKFAVLTEMQRRVDAGNGVMSWDAECVHHSINYAQWRLWVTTTDPGFSCYRQTDPGFNYFALMHYLFLVFASIFFITTMAGLLRRGLLDWRSGEYLVYTWELERTKQYRATAWLLVVFTVGSLIFFVLYIAGVTGERGTGLSFEVVFSETWLDFLVVLASSFTFVTIPHPAIDSKDPALRGTTFERPWYTIVMISNDEFANEIERALLKARAGLGKTSLEMLVGRGASLLDDERIARVFQAPQPHGVAAAQPEQQLEVREGPQQQEP
mmetsp:Transcript_465/g.928  ORF Transcript_465/g.928 Transcript_465/m.928 type:complete len:300 (+) Transcript_465:75-974(+)